jgi:hypothetical protein
LPHTSNRFETETTIASGDEGMSDNWYPQKLVVGDQGTPATYEFMQTVYRKGRHFSYAEFGFYEASTAVNICRIFENATLHLFDYEDKVVRAKARLSTYAGRVHYYGSTQKYNDSYNWNLMKLIEENTNNPIFDYCFLDGAHTVAIDALNYFLCDKLLRVGGFMDFDDYGWRLRGSSLDPVKIPAINEQYTAEQIDSFQVKMIVDTLVRPDPRYREVLKNKVFQKISN